MAQVFGLHPWDIERLTVLELVSVFEVLEEMRRE